MTRALLISSLACVLLAACSGGNQDELQQWMKDNTKDMRGRIPPLPQVKPYAPVAYDASGIIPPFSDRKLAVETKQGGGSGIQPDMNRPKEPLEAFPLESIKYVGVIEKKKQSCGIVTADGALYQVRTGNYMGQNFGVITRISETEMNLRELVQDPNGDWVERVSSLQLQATGGK